MSSVRSRPSSALSTVEVSRSVSSSVNRPVAAPRRGSAVENENFIAECKAAYIAVFDDLKSEIESKQELCKVLQQAGRSPTSKVLAKYWRTSTETLTFEDFCDICRREPATNEDDLIRAFRRIDVNNDGYITNSELRKILTTRGEKMTIAEVQKIIDDVDQNGDGKLDYKEFAQMIIKTQQECTAVAIKSMEKKLGTSSTKISPRTSKSPLNTVERTGNSLSQVSLRSEKSTLIGSRSSVRSVDVIDNTGGFHAVVDERPAASMSTHSERDPNFSGNPIEDEGDGRVVEPVSRGSGTSSRRDSDVASVETAISESRTSLRSTNSRNSERQIRPLNTVERTGNSLSQVSLRSETSTLIGSRSSVTDGFPPVVDERPATSMSTHSERDPSFSGNPIEDEGDGRVEEPVSRGSGTSSRRDSDVASVETAISESRTSLRSTDSRNSNRRIRDPHGSHTSIRSSTSSRELGSQTWKRSTVIGQAERKESVFSNKSSSSSVTMVSGIESSPDTGNPLTHHVAKDYGDDSDDDIVIGTSRSASHSTIRDGVAKPDPTKPKVEGHVREWSKPGLPKQASLVKPRTLREWKMARSKGCFFYNEKDKIISHQYSLKTTQDSSVWITIEPLCMVNTDLNSKSESAGSAVDMILFILDTDDGLVAFSEQRDVKGKYALNCDLKKGSYKLLAFTTGCRFKKRISEPSRPAELVNRKKDGHVLLTKEFKDALRKVFDMADLSCSETLSRDEFKLYTLRTTGQELDESLWQVVEDKVELVDDCITWQGFLELTQLEAEDLDDEDDEDLWVTLKSMGFNKNLVLDEASPFMIEVYAERCTPTLKVTSIDEGGKVMSNAVTTMVKRRGEESRVRGSKDLLLHSYAVDYRMSLVIENRSTTKQRVEVDCRKNDNVTSSQPSGFTCIVDVPAKSSAVAHHLLPKKDFQPWNVVCAESVK